MEQSFAYEKKQNEICILRCYGTSGSIKIPEELEGLPVTELSAYAFAQEMEAEPENTSGLPCICGSKLEELYLPCTIVRLGRYIFYNCIQFRKFSLYSNLAFMGAGAFTGCENLCELELRQLEGKSCLREILQDLKQKVTVECYQGFHTAEDKKQAVREGQSQREAVGNSKGNLLYRLVYPEFFEEAVENTPARIISTQTHGMGIQYRNTFRNTQVVFQEYDQLFETGKHNIELENIVEMTCARLRYPYELDVCAKQAYAQWLSEHLEEGAQYFLEQEDMENLRWLAQEFVTEEMQANQMLGMAKECRKPEAVSMLMDVKHERFPGKKKRFTL